MNIWILNHYATPPDIPGSTRHFDFATELIKHHNKVTIFAASFRHSIKKQLQLKKDEKYVVEKIGGLTFFWLRTFSYKENDWRRALNMISFFFQVISIGLKSKEKPDVILASSPHLFTGLAGYLLAKQKKSPFIFEVRDLWPQTLIDIGKYSKNSPIVVLLRTLEKFLYVHANKIVVLLPKASDYITGTGTPGHKITYIPNGVRADLCACDSVNLPSDMTMSINKWKSQGQLLGVYTGAHGIANALDTIVEAAKYLADKRFNNIHFLFVGDGTEKERLISLVKSLNLTNISFHDSIPNNIVPKLLGSIDISLISVRKTSLYKYGVSLNKLFTYMGCSKPVIWASDTVNNPVAEANCGFTVPPEDAETMAAAILKLCNLSESERGEMGNRGYEYVTKYHSIPVLAKKMLEVMEDVNRK